MSQHALDDMCKNWGWEPAHSVSGHTLGTGISAAVWESPDTSDRILTGTDTDVFILAYHPRGLSQAHLVLDQDPVYDGLVGSGSWLVVPPGGRPRARVRGSWNVLHLYVPAPFVSQISADAPQYAVRQMVANCTRLQRDRRLSSLLNRIETVVKQDVANNALLVEALCAQAAAVLLSDFARSRGAANALRERLAPWQRRRAEDIIDQRALQGLNAMQLAEALGMSRSHFSRAYRRETGMTVRDAIMERRLHEVRRRLEFSTDRITKIAFECGFSSSSHLANIFRARYGETPRDVRARTGR